jgi:hypothetical protein
LYAKSGEVDLTGTGSAFGGSLGSMLVAGSLKLTGAGNFNIGGPGTHTETTTTTTTTYETTTTTNTIPPLRMIRLVE